MQEALQSLPCVEASSVEVDFDAKEARFTVKKDGKCDLEAIKKVVKVAGFTVSAVKAHVRDATVVKTHEGKITLTSKGDDQKHTHVVAEDAKITLDDKKAKLEELKEGFSASVTINDKLVITKIEARSKSK